MNVCFLLHFYQPSSQSKEVFDRIAQECYVPLIKLIKRDRRIKVTVNLPLSFLEQLDLYGYGTLIQDIKELINADRIEIVGSAGYHPLLTKIPPDFIAKQVIINEAALGYYLGSHKDFEGEDCFMIKGLKGFFPPEMAVNEYLLKELASLGYDWVAVDEFAFSAEIRSSSKNTCFCLEGQFPKLIVRDHSLTNQIAFKRDLDCSVLINSILSDGVDKFIALDAETFGHHYRDGIVLFESMISDIYSRGAGTSTVSETFCDCACKKVPHINESTWGSTEEVIYPHWVNPTGEVSQRLWEMFEEVHRLYHLKYHDEGSVQGIGEHWKDSSGVPIWKYKDSGDNKDTTDRIKVELAMLKLEQSDQFWQAVIFELGEYQSYAKGLVISALNYYAEIAPYLVADESLTEKINEINKILDSKL